MVYFIIIAINFSLLAGRGIAGSEVEIGRVEVESGEESLIERGTRKIVLKLL